MITFKITTPASDIQQAIGDAIAKHAYNSVYNPVEKLKNQVASFVQESIDASPEADDLINGFLRVEFGLVNPAENVQSVITAIIKAAKVIPIPFKYVGQSLMQGQIGVGVLQKDLRDLLALPSASYFSDGKHADDVKWLEWLLIGDKDTVIPNFIISYSPVHKDYSRTGGGALMFPGERGYSLVSSGFVPDSFTGTIEDNWLTRALSKIEGYLTPLVEREFRRAFA